MSSGWIGMAYRAGESHVRTMNEDARRRRFLETVAWRPRAQELLNAEKARRPWPDGPARWTPEERKEIDGLRDQTSPTD